MVPEPGDLGVSGRLGIRSGTHFQRPSFFGICRDFHIWMFPLRGKGQTQQELGRRTLQQQPDFSILFILHRQRSVPPMKQPQPRRRAERKCSGSEANVRQHGRIYSSAWRDGWVGWRRYSAQMVVRDKWLMFTFNDGKHMMNSDWRCLNMVNDENVWTC